jgi:hypothetical protein
VTDMQELKRYKLIACEIMFREISLCASKCKNIIDITFMPKGLHDIGSDKMSERLQSEINKADYEKYEAILLAYGLCNNGIKGLHSELPIVIPRAHDCITLLLGSRQKYDDFFKSNPGTFFKSPGWIERDASPNESEQSVTSQLGMNKTYQEYVELFGEENARYLMETMGDWLKNYSRIAFIDTGTGDAETYRKLTKQQAFDNQWEYEELKGDTGLLLKLLNGEWDDESFLLVPPDYEIKPTGDDDLITKASLATENKK